jgi:hypothetical protein
VLARELHHTSETIETLSGGSRQTAETRPGYWSAVDDANPVATNRNASRKTRAHKGDRTMKTMILALAAILGIAAGAATLTTEAHASKTYLFQAAQYGNG